MPTTRCYNCGVSGHQTQVCPRYGPRYPEPGKSTEDYAELAQQIMNQVAADILLEHANVEERDEVAAAEIRPPRKQRPKPRPPIEQIHAVREVTCPSCGSLPGKACRSKDGGRLSDSHRDRRKAYLEAQH